MDNHVNMCIKDSDFLSYILGQKRNNGCGIRIF